MHRHLRNVHPDPWARSHDFNEQLYLALRQSPWWMISVAFHVLIFVVAGLLYEQQAQAAVEQQVAVETLPITSDQPDEQEPDEPDVPTSPIDVPPPPVNEADLAEHDERDVDMPFQETFGDEGLSDDPFHGPAKNGIIGLGGGAGGAFGRGRGGMHDLKRGGSRHTENALEDALKWLAAHQSPNGAWEAAGFMRWCDGRPVAEGPAGAGKAHYDVGVTGLALCAFLGAGYTNRGRHPFARTIARGLQYLKNVQDAEGCFGPRATQHYIYNHATASLAMVEAYGMTASPLFRGPAQKALDFIALARNPYFAWRYGVKPGDNDTSVSGWMMMAMKSARLVNEDAVRRGKPAPLTIDEDAFDGVLSWIDKMTDPDTGRTGYVQRGGLPARPQEMIDRFPGEKSESMTGVGVLARVFCGQDPKANPVIRMGVDLCAARPPTWNETDGSIDMYYWYYATLAMYQVGGKPWKVWNEHLKTDVVDHQRKDTTTCLYKGSWDPIGPWGPEGGRVYSTALLAMCLEVYYRYPVFTGR